MSAEAPFAPPPHTPEEAFAARGTPRPRAHHSLDGGSFAAAAAPGTLAQFAAALGIPAPFGAVLGSLASFGAAPGNRGCQRRQEAGAAPDTVPGWGVAAFLLRIPQGGSRDWGRGLMKAVGWESHLRGIGAGLERRGLATFAVAAAGWMEGPSGLSEVAKSTGNAQTIMIGRSFQWE